jgi:dihydropteroate synthase
MTEIVAIINITPDSFSDGRKNATTEDYLALIQQAIEEGATILDIGAESTRPGATLLTQEEEWKRLKPILQQIKSKAILSIDTRYPQTFRDAIEYGAQWFNDISGLQNVESTKLAAECKCDVVLMHSLTVPADPKITFSEGTNVVQAVLDWAEKRIAELKLPKDKIIFDPGIGFGKTAAQCWELIENIAQFKTLGVRLMVGHSRKSFLGLPMEQRDAATAEITRKLAQAGVDYVRVHNVKANHQVIISA